MFKVNTKAIKEREIIAVFKSSAFKTSAFRASTKVIKEKEAVAVFKAKVILGVVAMGLGVASGCCCF